MKFPKLKNSLLCYISLGVLVIGLFLMPFAVAMCISLLSDALSVIVLFLLLFVDLVILIKNFTILLGAEILIDSIHCANKARKYFVLPKHFDKEIAESKIARFGKSYDPIGIYPKPDILLYKATSSMTVLSSGLEKTVALYKIDYLDKEKYLSAKASAAANSKALIRKKKVFADKIQKSEPLNRVTVFYIFAEKVDDGFRAVLYEEVCKSIGNGFDEVILPCVVDLELSRCYFDSMRIPFAGNEYPAINRGINLIRKHLFNNRFTYADSKEIPDDFGDFDREKSLWEFLREFKKDLVTDERNTRKRFAKMSHKDIVVEDDYLYLKWNDRGLWVSVELPEESNTVTIDVIEYWDHPKHQKMSKQDVAAVKKIIDAYYSGLGYRVKYE